MTIHGYLLDTNVISETSKPHPDWHVLAFLESQALDAEFEAFPIAVLNPWEYNP